MTEFQLLTAFEKLEKENVIRANFPSIISFQEAEKNKTKSFCFCGGTITEINKGTFYELHRLLLKKIPDCKAVFQPHSHWACVWAALGKSLPPVSMTHAVKFFGEIFCTDDLYLEQINGNLAGALYEKVQSLYEKSFPYKLNAVLLDQIGPLLMGKTIEDTFELAAYLEEAAEIAYKVRNIDGVTYRHMHYALMEKFYTEGLGK